MTYKVQGREAEILGDGYDGFIIYERAKSAELYRDGVWRNDVDYGSDRWPTYAEALAFLEQHADGVEVGPAPRDTLDAAIEVAVEEISQYLLCDDHAKGVREILDKHFRHLAAKHFRRQTAEQATQPHQPGASQ